MKSIFQIFSTEYRDTTIVRICSIAWMLAKLLSLKLWFPGRLFPTLPFFESLPVLPQGLHFFLAAFSLVALAATFFFPSNRWIIFAVIATEFILCFFDQMRWQPWEYQYLLTFIFWLCCLKNKRGFLELLRFLIAVTYIFSGLHKCSEVFLSDIWDGIQLHLFGFSPRFITTNAVHYSGLLIAVVEFSIGAGLLFAKNKKGFVYGCIIMHASILLLLGPIGLNFNSVVWPWNVAMPVLAYYLFYKNPATITVDFFKPYRNKFVFFLLVILPTGNFFGLWNDYFSFNLYSGGVERIFICADETTRIPQLKPYESISYCGRSSTTTDINKWVFSELNVPLYPSEAAYKTFKKQFLKEFPGPNYTFLIYDFPYQEHDVRQIE